MSPSEFEELPEEERPRATRHRRQARQFQGPVRWIALGMLLAVLVAVVAALTVSQTRWGREQVLAFTLGTLGGRLDGSLTIERIDGNLLTGAHLYDVALRKHNGEPLAIADSAYIRYRVGTLLGGDIVIPRITAWNAEVTIVRAVGDSLWNYQEILTDPTPDPIPGAPSATLIERLELYGSRISIRSPLEPDDRLTAEEQQLALDEILADSARWVVEAVPGGYLREMLIDVQSAGVDELFIGPDERGGIYLEVTDALADVRMWRDPPLQLLALQAELHLREGFVNFEASELVLPDTRGEMVGRIDLNQGRPMYDVVLTTPAFALSDLRWLYPWLPADAEAGRGAARIWIEDRPDDLLVLARNLTLDMPGTRVTGEFGLLAGGALRFVNVEVDAEPLDMASIERLLPEGLPVEGLSIDGAVIRGDS